MVASNRMALKKVVDARSLGHVLDARCEMGERWEGVESYGVTVGLSL